MVRRSKWLLIGLGSFLLLLGVAFLILDHLAHQYGEPQNPVAPEQLKSTLKRYLSDRRVAAGEKEVARHMPWSEMGRRKKGKKPFGGDPPKFVDEEEFLGDRPEILDLWKRHEDDSVDNDRFLYILEKAGELTKKDQHDDQAWFLMAMSLREVGREKASLPLFDYIIKRHPGFWKAYLEKGILLSDMRRFGESLVLFDQAHAIQEDWEIYLNRGIALCFAGRFDESEWDLWKAIEADPKDGNAYYDVAWIHAQRREPAAAVEMLRYTSRDSYLFGKRISRATLMGDAFLKPIRSSPEFMAYVALLPTHDLVEERNWRTLSQYGKGCSLLYIMTHPWTDCKYSSPLWEAPWW